MIDTSKQEKDQKECLTMSKDIINKTVPKGITIEEYKTKSCKARKAEKDEFERKYDNNLIP